MKKFLIQAILLVLVIALGFMFFNPARSSQKLDLPFLPQPQKTATLLINGSSLKVEIADTPSQRNKGLGGRDSLADDAGMLFVFDKVDKHQFWMKGMNFALDFVWIRDNVVIDLLPNIPPPAKDTPDSALAIYQAKEPVDKVLEVNAGTIQRLNIKIGDNTKLIK